MRPDVRAPRDIDLGRRQITVFGKGQKSRVIPLRGRLVLEIEAYLLEPLPFAGAGARAGRLHPLSGEADRWRAAPGGVPEAPNKWSDRAPLVVPPRRGGRSRRSGHDERATHASRSAHVCDRPPPHSRPRRGFPGSCHSDLSTTAAIYGHYDLSDLERAMEALARSRREDEEPTD